MSRQGARNNNSRRSWPGKLLGGSIKLFAILLGGLVVPAGCRLCDSSYDHCGPLVSMPGEECDPSHRAGSIYNQQYLLAARSSSPPSDSSSAYPDLWADAEIRSGIILSITDRPLHSGQSPTPPDQAGDPETGPALITQQAQPVPREGWTAINPRSQNKRR